MTVLDPVITYLLGCKLGKRVSLNQVMTGADRPRRPVLRVMDRLVKDGYLLEIADNKESKSYGEGGPARRNPTWEVLSPPTLKPRQPKRRTIRDRIWQAIRMKRRFSPPELASTSGVPEGSVRNYVKLLTRTGYLRVTGRDGIAQVYLLIKDPGPQRPAIKEVANG